MKKLKKIAVYVVSILIIAAIIVVIISPFKYHSDDFRTVEATIDISAPVDSVFLYMENSVYASNWSSYVDHISPLNPQEYKDGTENSIRRVFVNKDERGSRWDEKILEVTKNQSRTLSIFNIHEMSLSADGLQTEQRYERLSDSESCLSLVLYFDSENNSYWNQFWMHIASFRIKSIFKKNLENIKREIESKSKV